MTQRIFLAEQKVVCGFSASTDNNIQKNVTMARISFFGKVIKIDKVLHDIAYSLFYLKYTCILVEFCFSRRRKIQIKIFLDARIYLQVFWETWCCETLLIPLSLRYVTKIIKNKNNEIKVISIPPRFDCLEIVASFESNMTLVFRKLFIMYNVL